VKGTDDEAITVHGRADHCGVARAEGRRADANTGVSSATFYKWKAVFGGLDVSEARRLKALEGRTAG
jgi:putative transposase